MVSRYQFLAMLHDVLRPATYLDIGVQNGHSLKLAGPKCMAVGVDPVPTPEAWGYVRQNEGYRNIYVGTSDDFFARTTIMGQCFDLVSIDGMHLFEYALRDFLNAERHAHAGTVVAFDDASPYSSAIAGRIQCPGDWTGDVWKLRPLLAQYRPDVTTVLVDTFPTGTLLAWNLDPSYPRMTTEGLNLYEVMERHGLDLGEEVPAEIINERGVQPHVAIEMLQRREA